MHTPIILTDVRIPTSSGNCLSATLYLPNKEANPASCILAFTPYGADAQHERGRFFSANGFAFAAVDVRGRGSSEGTFVPQTYEAEDGADVVAWLAQQPFCNGKVGMCGGSYLGYAQWATISRLPQALETIVPTAAPCPGVDSPMRRNIVAPERLQWAALVAGRAVQANLYADDAHWSAILREWFRSGASFRDLDRFSGQRSEILQEILDHPAFDTYWRGKSPSADQYARIDRPVLTITGAYDDDQPGALAHYRAHRTACPVGAFQHYLVIGPWDHASAVKPGRSFGGLDVGPESVIDIAALHLEWFRWVMSGAARPAFLKDRVTYYVIGADVWQAADSLEAITTDTLSLYLDSNGTAGGAEPGTLTPTPGTGVADAYVYDPRVVDGPEIDAEFQTPKGTIVGNSLVTSLMGRQLVYDMEPFAQDIVIAGFFELEAWIGINCPDTDLYATVYEVDSSGLHTRLSTDAIRARYREGLDQPILLTDDLPTRYVFDKFTFVSRLCRTGSHLRLILSPAGRLVDTQYCQKNFNGGGIVAEETAADGRPVTVHLIHEGAQQTILRVPIGRLDQLGHEGFQDSERGRCEG